MALNVRRADVVQVGATRDFLFDRTNHLARLYRFSPCRAALQIFCSIA